VHAALVRRLILAVILVRFAAVCPAQSVPSGNLRQTLDDAWWTGPMLAPSAATLPRGHFLIEPYLFDVTVQGKYDRYGVRRPTPHANDFGSLTYLLYGITNNLSVGVIPTADYNLITGQPSSRGPGLGDVTVQGQYRLTQFHENHWFPTTSFAVQETFPTGKYDQLGNRLSDAHGSGAYTTTLAFYSQTYFWLRNGRILRMRLNVSEGLPSQVNIHNVSVYGTQAGFYGHARLGKPLFVDGAWEYSLSRSWVLALDATYSYAGNTRVTGYDTLSPNSPITQLNFGSSEAFGLAPALEYSWTPKLGVLAGVRFVPAGRNVQATITPAVAVNFVH